MKRFMRGVDCWLGKHEDLAVSIIVILGVICIFIGVNYK